MVGLDEETPGDVFEAVLEQLQDWKWERFASGTSQEFQDRLDENSREWRARFDAAERRFIATLRGS